MPPPPLYWDKRNRTNKRAAIAVGAMVLTAMVFPAQAQTTNICDRTQQVVDAILQNTVVNDTCDSANNIGSSDSVGIALALSSKGITSLRLGDFDGLTSIQYLVIENNPLTDLPAGIFSGLPNLFHLTLRQNQLNNLPDGIFSGLTKLGELFLDGNPGAPFRFTLTFEPETLEENFTAVPVRLVSDKTALLPITVRLSVIGGRLIDGAPDSLTIPESSTQSDTVTVLKGTGYFRLAQEEPQLGSLTSYSGIEVVRGPAITLGGIRVRARVFLEGALE